MAKIRKEIPLINTIHTATASNFAELDTAKYTGATYYFEIVGKVTSGTSTVTLQRVTGGTNDATVNLSDTSYTRSRTSSFTPPAGATEYKLAISGGTSPSITTAKIIIIQEADTIAATQSYFLIGNQETGKTNTASAALTSPKYYKNTAANFDGSTTYEVEAVYSTSSKNTCTITLQQDNGSFAGWADLVTIVSAGSNTTPTRSRVSFTPTDGRHYRIASLGSTTKSNYSIYGAAVIITQRVINYSTSDDSLTTAGTSTSVTLTKPAGLTNADYLFIFLYFENTDSITWPSGFTEGTATINQTDATLPFRGRYAYKHITNAAGEPSTYAPSWSTSAWAQGAIFRVSSINTTSPINGETSAISSGNSATSPAVSVTPSSSGCLIIHAPLFYASSTTAGHTGYSEELDSGHNLKIYTKYQGAAAAESNIVATHDFANATCAAFLIALNPSGSITKTESTYWLLNTADDNSTTKQTRQILWDSSEWSGVTNTYYHVMDSDNASNSCKLVDIDNADATVTNSSVTGANRVISSALTMPTTGHQIDTKIDDTTGVVASSRILVLVSVQAAAPADLKPAVYMISQAVNRASTY